MMKILGIYSQKLAYVTYNDINYINHAVYHIPSTHVITGSLYLLITLIRHPHLSPSPHL